MIREDGVRRERDLRKYITKHQIHERENMVGRSLLISRGWLEKGIKEKEKEYKYLLKDVSSLNPQKWIKIKEWQRGWILNKRKDLTNEKIRV